MNEIIEWALACLLRAFGMAVMFSAGWSIGKTLRAIGWRTWMNTALCVAALVWFFVDDTVTIREAGSGDGYRDSGVGEVQKVESEDPLIVRRTKVGLLIFVALGSGLVLGKRQREKDEARLEKRRALNALARERERT